MSEEICSEREVVLEIENVGIKCFKQDLIKHSDYFKAMFEGNFIESSQKVVKLEGIDLKAMNIILALLWDRTFLINEEDILSVLQVSCMLQFIEIKTMCLSKLTELLLPRNCLKIWIVAEQLDLKPLYLKAKSMSLIEFNTIKDLDGVTELQLKQLCNYLANVNLQCKSEMDVFQTFMKWWYENVGKYLKTDYGDIFCTLLSCLDFNSLYNSDIQEILIYPDISAIKEIINILQCVLDLRQNLIKPYDENIVQMARKLCNSKSRICKQYLGLLVNTNNEEQIRKKQRMSIDIYSDTFMRKRYYKNLDACDPANAIIYYDNNVGNFVKLLDIDKEKCGNLDGFKIIGYKEFIFLFGGEYLLGKGNWNRNFWVYDMVRQGWERKSVLPFVRRHFEACICGNYIYILGGTGKFRVIQDNMFWYNYKEDKWSKEIELPCFERPVKCCNWNNQLFLLSISKKCGYIFDQEKSLWYKLDISTNSDSICHLSFMCTVFAYRNHLYVKGEDGIIELKLKDQCLVVASFRPIESINIGLNESFVCNNVVYTLYKQTIPEEVNLTLEKYCMRSQKQEILFKEVVEGSELELQGQLYSYKMSTSIFGIQHYNLIEHDDFVNQL